MCDRDEEDEIADDAPDAEADEDLGDDGDAIAEILQDEQSSETRPAAEEHGGKTAASHKTMCVFLFILNEFVE